MRSSNRTNLLKIEPPFIHHIGVGEDTGEPWLSCEGDRLKLDVLFTIFTHTFAWSFDQIQEYAMFQQILEYRDWLECVIGHVIRIDFHLVLYERAVNRKEITQILTNQFWLSAHDTWCLLKPCGIEPSRYDLVWCAWAWENSRDAFQMYGGGTSPGPDNTPFMSFPVFQFWPGEPGPYLIMEHEAQHTFEILWSNLGYPIVTDLQEDISTGWPHADSLRKLLVRTLEEEPGIFEPLASEQQALEYGRPEGKQWPGSIQTAIHAWIQRRWPRKNWLSLLSGYGEIVAPRSQFLAEPLFSSITVVTSTGTARPLFIPLRVRDAGRHIPNLDIEGFLGSSRIMFHENTYRKPRSRRLPRQIRWSIGWDGLSYYGAWVTVPLQQASSSMFSVCVHDMPVFEPLTIPIRIIGSSDL